MSRLHELAHNLLLPFTPKNATARQFIASRTSAFESFERVEINAECLRISVFTIKIHAYQKRGNLGVICYCEMDLELVKTLQYTCSIVFDMLEPKSVSYLPEVMKVLIFKVC